MSNDLPEHNAHNSSMLFSSITFHINEEIDIVYDGAITGCMTFWVC